MRLVRLVVVAVVALGLSWSVSPPAPVEASARTASVKHGCAVKRAAATRAARRARARARRACLIRRAAARRTKLPAAVEPVPVAPEDGKLAFALVSIAAAPEQPVPVAPVVSDVVDVPAGVPAPVASTLGVDAYDFGTFVLRMTRTAVPAGTLTIYFRNHDSSEHNLWIESPGLGAPLVVSEAVGENGGATTTLPVVAGAWRLYCSLPGHDAMSRTLTVG